jgi:hypothetical protein
MERERGSKSSDAQLFADCEICQQEAPKRLEKERSLFPSPRTTADIDMVKSSARMKGLMTRAMSRNTRQSMKYHPRIERPETIPDLVSPARAASRRTSAVAGVPIACPAAAAAATPAAALIARSKAV